MPEPLPALIFWDSSTLTPNALLQRQRQKQVREVNKNSLPILPSQVMDTRQQAAPESAKKTPKWGFPSGRNG